MMSEVNFSQKFLHKNRTSVKTPIQLKNGVGTDSNGNSIHLQDQQFPDNEQL